jgi:heat shock protein HslJ
MTRVAALSTVLAFTVGLQTLPLEKITWRLVTMPGHSSATIAALTRPITIRFDSGRVTGFSGCNAFNGPYTLHESRVTFGDCAGTMMACGEPAMAALEESFRRLLVGRVSYSTDIARLTVITTSGAILTFEKEARATFETATWTVTGYDNGRGTIVSPIAETELTVTFVAGSASGTAGCNTFRARYTADESRLTLGPVTTTRRACAPPMMAQEAGFLAALASTVGWTIEENTLRLLRADGQPVLTGSRR